MRTTHSIFTLVAGLSLALLSAPSPASATDCGGDYVACINDSGAAGTSDALHETECYGEYVSCLERQLRFY